MPGKVLMQYSFGYMGYDSFDTYDIATCASRCTARNGCVSINMYFERNPSGIPILVLFL